MMKGISTRKTSLGWDVFRLHYTADPDKDPNTPAGKKWCEETFKGLPDARRRKEYEIDYGAMGGQLVFPEFDESIHLVQPHVLLDKEYWTTYLACDPHPRRAHAFVWLCVNRIGEMVIPWSYWPEAVNKQREQNGDSRLLIKQYAEDIRQIDGSGLFPPCYVELMDQAGKNFNQDEEHTFFDGYRAEDITFRPAKKNREYAGYELISKALVPKKWSDGVTEEMRPTLTIFRGCGDNDLLVEQFKNLRFREFRGIVVDKDPPADPMEKDRHLIDCLSYILLDDPRFIDPRGGLSTFEPIYPNLAY
jgi:hypothetical protein